MEQNVEVGPIWDQRNAEVVAAKYIQNHPEFVWTGHWNTTIPGKMSTIQIRRRDVRERNTTDDIARSSQPQQEQNVEVGPIWNQSHAAQVALKYTQNHAQYEWTGQWNTTKAGKMSTIQIRRRETGQNESLNCDLSSGIGQSASGSQGIPDASNKTEGDARPNVSSSSSVPTPSCPVCYEALKPPQRIFQCANGHLICEVCHGEPQLRGCPVCRQPIMGRATVMEQFLVDLQNGAQRK
eukprot:GFUD01080197.1.p1 GENE.GFUD01080197.1~~GFUD01080197.1.p1  ORF type:complete len:238 (-),score=48.14 GFUD01080197.1:61-774(-)